MVMIRIERLAACSLIFLLNAVFAVAGTAGDVAGHGFDAAASGGVPTDPPTPQCNC